MAPIYLFQRSEPLGSILTADMLRAHVNESHSEELQMLFGNGVCSIVPTDQISVGIDIRSQTLMTPTLGRVGQRKEGFVNLVLQMRPK